MVNTKERIKQAALKLFSEQGYVKTSIGAIEKEAGLAPRAGAFYRHFESKQALFHDLARSHIAEQEEEFDLDGLRAFNDTRAELISLAQAYEKASRRQAPYLRLIEEFRNTVGGIEAESDVNDEMLQMLMRWVASKPAGRRLKKRRLASLTMCIFGGWLFYMTKMQQGITVPILDRDDLLDTWATTWANVLDQKNR